MLKTACGLQVPSILKQYSRENTAFSAGYVSFLGVILMGSPPGPFERRTARVCLVESIELEFGMKTPMLVLPCTGSVTACGKFPRFSQLISAGDNYVRFTKAQQAQG